MGNRTWASWQITFHHRNQTYGPEKGQHTYRHMGTKKWLHVVSAGPEEGQAQLPGGESRWMELPSTLLCHPETGSLRASCGAFSLSPQGCDNMSGGFAGLTPSQMGPPRDAGLVGLRWGLWKVGIPSSRPSPDAAGSQATSLLSTLWLAHGRGAGGSSFLFLSVSLR